MKNKQNVDIENMTKEALESTGHDLEQMKLEAIKQAARFGAIGKHLSEAKNGGKMLDAFEGFPSDIRTATAFRLGCISSRLENLLDPEHSQPIISEFPAEEIYHQIKDADEPAEALFGAVLEYLEAAYYIGYCQALADEWEKMD